MIVPILMLDKPYPKSGNLYPSALFEKLVGEIPELPILDNPTPGLSDGEKIGTATGFRIRTEGINKTLVCDTAMFDKDQLVSLMRGEARLTLDMLAELDCSGPCPAVARVEALGPVAYLNSPPADPSLTLPHVQQTDPGSIPPPGSAG